MTGEAVGYEIPRAELALTIHVQIGAPAQIGQVPGGAARVIPITGGAFEGSGLKGAVMPGGADWQITRPDGVTELRAHYGLQCEDGIIVQVNNRCLVVRGDGGARVIRSVLSLEAPEGPHDWLNKAVFVGTLNAPGDDEAPVVIRAFRIL